MSAVDAQTKRIQEIVREGQRTGDLVGAINKRVREKQELRDRIIAMVNDPHQTTTVLLTVEAILEDHDNG